MAGITFQLLSISRVDANMGSLLYGDVKELKSLYSTLMDYIGRYIDISIDNIADYILHSNTLETPVSWRPSRHCQHVAH